MAVLLAGCGGSDKPAAVKTEPLPQEPVQMVEGKNFDGLATSPMTVGGQTVGLVGLADDHTAYGTVGNPVGGGPSKPVIVDLRAKTATPLMPDDKNARADHMAASKDWIVWIDGGPVDRVKAWSMYSYERSSGTVRLIGSLNPKGTEGVMLGELNPSINAGVVFVSAVSGAASDGGPISGTYSVPADGSSPMKRILQNSSFSAAGDGVLVYTRGDRLFRRDLKTGKESAPPYCDDWVVGDGVLACTRGADHTVRVITADGKRSSIDITDGSSSLIAASSGWLAIDNPDSPVYDLRSKRFLITPAGWILAPLGGYGHYLEVMREDVQARTEFIRLR